MEEVGDGVAPKRTASDIIAEAELMNSVVNEQTPDIPLILRSDIIKLSAIAGYDAEEAKFGDFISWENLPTDNDRQMYYICVEAAIKKFCELEGIKQEFKGDSYRLIGRWRKP